METEKEFADLMMNNYDESLFVMNKFNQVRGDICDAVRTDVLKGLQKLFVDNYDFKLGDKIESNYSQLWITPKEITKSEYCFGFESFGYKGTGHQKGALFIGVFTRCNNQFPDFKNDKDKSFSEKYYKKVYFIKDINNLRINLSTPETIKNLQLDDEFRKNLIAIIIKQASDYINKYTDPLIKFLNR